MKPNRLKMKLIALAVLASLPGSALAVRVDYDIDAGYERDDNVTLSATDPIEQNIFRAGLGFAIEQNSSTVQAGINGRIDHRRYEDIYDDATERMLQGRLNWVIVPERFSFTIEDSYGVQTVDRFEPDAPDNRQQVNVLSLGPNFFFNFGRTLGGQAELRYIDSDAEVTEDFNSQRIAGAFRMVKKLDETSTLSFNLQAQDVDFENDLFARDHSRTEAFASLEREFNAFDMRAEAGYSWLDYDDGASESNPLLRAELGWNLSERSRFEINAASLFSDAATNALESISADNGIPPSVMTGADTITPSAYKIRELGGNYAYTGERMIVSLSTSVQNIDYFDAGSSQEKGRDAMLSLSYRLRQTLTLHGSASFNRTEYVTPANRIEKNRLYTLSLSKRWSPHWRSSLGISRYQRTSPSIAAEFEQNVVYLSVTYSNR